MELVEPIDDRAFVDFPEVVALDIAGLFDREVVADDIVEPVVDHPVVDSRTVVVVDENF